MPADPEHHAALRAAGLDPRRVERIGEGWFAVAYRSGDRADDRVVRVLKPEAATAGWVEAYEREVGLLRRLERRGLPVPRAAEAIRAADGRLLGTVADFLAGTPVRRLHLRGGARARLARELGEFLDVLHSTPLADVRALGIPELDLGTELYAPLVEEALPLLRARSRDWLRARLDEFMAGGGSRQAPRVPVHGDLDGEHVLSGEDGRLRGVLDFGDALIGDAAFDVAGLLNAFSWRFVDLMLASYAGPAAHDADLPRRAAFYIDVAPLYALAYGVRLGDARLERHGRRQLAARAAAATRAAR